MTYAGLLEDRRDRALRVDRHDVDARDAGYLGEARDDLAAQLLALGAELLRARVREPVTYAVRDDHARDRGQVRQCSLGPYRSDARQDVAALVQAEVADPRHPGRERRHV